MSHKNRNKMNLTLPATSAEEKINDIPNSKTAVSRTSSTNNEANKETSTVNIEEELKRLHLTDAQEKRMKQWILQKQRIGELNGDELEKICDLGFGNGGAVVKVKHKASGIIMARKLMHLEVKPTTCNQIIKELKVLNHCNSPYIVGFYGAFYSDGEISLCMEYMDGLSLDIILKKAGRIPEPMLGKICFAVLSGLQCLKDELKSLHRDVKPSNVLVNSQGEIKLCDFGVSGALVNSMANTFVGTRSYMAPERITGNCYDVKSDVWSLGLSVVELAIGRYPIPPPSPEEYAQLFGKRTQDLVFTEEQRKSMSPKLKTSVGITTPPANVQDTRLNMPIFELLDYIVNEPPSTLPKGIWTDEFVDFVDKCLKKSLQDRATLPHLLSHPFIERARTQEVDFAGWVREMIQREVPADRR